MSSVSDVSVAMATLNGASYLEAQLDSVLGQSLPPQEIVISDDGSSDATLEILETYRAACPVIRILRGQGRGVTGNFDAAISACSQPYVALCDQDDIWLPSHLEVLRRNITASDLVYSDAALIDSAGQTLGVHLGSRFPLLGLDSNNPHLFRRLLLGSAVWGFTAMIRRDLLRAPMPTVPRNHDWWLSILASRRNGIVFVPEVISLYRVHDSNASRHFDSASIFRKSVGFFGSGRGAVRTRNAIILRDSLSAVKEHGFQLSDAEREDLEAAMCYAQDLLSSSNRWRRFRYALRYRHELFSTSAPTIRLGIALSRLLDNRLLLEEHR